ETNKKLDLEMWGQFDYLIAVSTEWKRAFIKQYPTLQEKVLVMENIVSSTFVKKQAEETIDHPFIHDNRFKVVTVARLSHAKGIDRAVEVLHLLKQRGMEQIVWYVVGYGG